MPMTSGTRMLRARRKDCNVKPNRRLDRKSSRGMLFENEELRMRTITINAEVEQGQHALKKLRRENEQLRREMWCLRDEYDKMEKLLRKKETDEDSDQENSDSDDNYTQTDESDDEKVGVGRSAQPEEENPDLENEENLQKSSKFGNDANVRTFDGLSVIDEQTEETQTTESAVGTLSRGESANRTFNQPVQYEEACGVPEFLPPPFGYPSSCYSKGPRKRGPCGYPEGPPFYEGWNIPQCDTYDVRPASPYPYNGSLRPSYQKRLQALQDLPLSPQTPANALGENGWIFPDPSKVEESSTYDGYNVDMTDYVKPLPPATFPYDFIQDRTGPDVFVTDGYPQVHAEPVQKLKDDLDRVDKSGISNVEAEIDKIEIGEKSERDPKIQEMTTLTKSVVSLCGANPGETQETLDPGKLTMDEAVDKNDNAVMKHGQHLVTCQNSYGQDVRETDEAGPDAAGPKNPSTDEMPQQQGSSKYQTKLTVTLKSPGTKGEPRGPKKVSTPVAPRNFHNLRYGIKPDLTMTQRFQTFPSPGLQPLRAAPVNGRDCLVNHYAGVRPPGPMMSGSLPRLPNNLPKNELSLTSSNIPDDMDKELDVLPDEESLLVPVAQPLVRPVKVPPAPPPRTSSCPKTIPAAPIGVTALHHRTFRKGKPLQLQASLDEQSEATVYNPLLLSHPIATSSPTISLKGMKCGVDASAENLYSSKYRKPSYNEESSLEDFSRQKSRLKEELNRADIPRLNKSVSSPSFGSFRTLRRKQSECLASSAENIVGQVMEVPSIVEKPEKRGAKSSQNNASVSSSSGLDSPGKSDRRKRRVSIQFKKKQTGGRHVEEEVRAKDVSELRRDSVAPGILSKGSERHKMKSKNDETDATTSERERTNSVSSRTSSVLAGSSRRKFSISSNRTYLNDEKIPWCGCWGNGCV